MTLPVYPRAQIWGEGLRGMGGEVAVVFGYQKIFKKSQRIWKNLDQHYCCNARLALPCFWYLGLISGYSYPVNFNRSKIMLTFVAVAVAMAAVPTPNFPGERAGVGINAGTRL